MILSWSRLLLLMNSHSQPVDCISAIQGVCWKGKKHFCLGSTLALDTNVSGVSAVLVLSGKSFQSFKVGGTNVGTQCSTGFGQVVWSVLFSVGGWGGGGGLDLSMMTWPCRILYSTESDNHFSDVGGKATLDYWSSPKCWKCCGVGSWLIELLIAEWPQSCQCSVWCGPLQYRHVLVQVRQRPCMPSLLTRWLWSSVFIARS